MQSPVELKGDHAEVCPEGEEIHVWFQERESTYRLEGGRLEVDYRYSVVHVTEHGKRGIYQSNSVHFHNHGEHTVNGLTGAM